MTIIRFDDEYENILRRGLAGKSILRYRDDERSILLVADSHKELESDITKTYPPGHDFWTRHYIEDY